jgi:predicted DNA-binding protein YlxM (UPF0122 family)
MPEGWTGIAKRKDTLFVVGRDGGETSFTALFAKTMDLALIEAADRNLLPKTAVHDSIEALQARLSELEVENLSITNDAMKFVAERDTAQAKLRELADKAFDTLAGPVTGYYRGLKLVMDTALAACHVPETTEQAKTAWMQWLATH